MTSAPVSRVPSVVTSSLQVATAALSTCDRNVAGTVRAYDRRHEPGWGGLSRDGAGRGGPGGRAAGGRVAAERDGTSVQPLQRRPRHPDPGRGGGRGDRRLAPAAQPDG